MSFSNIDFASLFANWKGPLTKFKAAEFVEFFDKNFSFIIWHKLAKFYYQTMFTSQVIQWNVYLVLCFWWRHEKRISKILKFDFLKNEKSF